MHGFLVRRGNEERIMESSIYAIVALALAALFYIAVRTVLASRRVGFTHFAKALGTLVGAFSLAAWKLATGAGHRKGEREEAEHRTPDPFLSPLEKSPTARNPLIENPIDNPEGYYVDDRRSG